MQGFTLYVNERYARLMAENSYGEMSVYPLEWDPKDPYRLEKDSYWERMARMTLDAVGPHGTVLMLGGCLGTIPMMMRKMGHKGAIYYVEPDNVIDSIGSAFGLKKCVRYAQKELDKTAKAYADGVSGGVPHWNACIVDAFDENGSIYPHREEFLEKYGHLFVHVIANPRGGQSVKWK